MEGRNKGRVVELDHPEVTLGRAVTRSEAAPGWVFFNEPTVSRVHAVLSWQERKKKYMLQHRSKTNPTLVNGSPVDQKFLEPGSTIQMGLLVLAFERASGSRKAETATGRSKRTGKPGTKEKKSQTSVVGPILEALSEVERQRKAQVPPASRRKGGDPPAPAPAFGWQPPPGEPPKTSEPSPRPQPRPAPTPPEPAARDFLERDAQTPINYRLQVAEGPDKGMNFPLDEMVLILGQRDGFDDPRSGQGILLNDPTLPKEQGMLVWQSREGTYGLLGSESSPVDIKVRRVTSGNPRDIQVDSQRPTLLQEGDVILMGNTVLVVRRSSPPQGEALRSAEKPAPQQPPRPQPKPKSDPPARRPGLMSPQGPAPESSEWQPGRSPFRTPEPSLGPAPAPEPQSQPEPTRSFRSEPQAQAFPMTPPPPLEPAPPAAQLPPRADQLARHQTPPAPTPTPSPAPPAAEAPSEVETSPVGQIVPRGVPPEVRKKETIWTRDATVASPDVTQPPASPAAGHSAVVGVTWPWQRRSDYIFDFLSGPNHGCQIPLMESDLPEGRTLTLGCSGERPNDIVVDSSGVANRQAQLRFRDRRFTLINEGLSGSMVVNGVPLKTNDQVLLMTGDQIELGDTTVRFLEYKVVEALGEFHLYVESGVATDQDRNLPFTRQRVMVGRGKTCEARLNDLEVSRVHVSIVYRDGNFFIAHRSETNPTFLNGISLLPGAERQLNPSDRIRLSSLTVLRFLRREPAARARAGLR